MKNQKRVQEALDRARNEILEAPQQQSLDEEPKENATIVIERKQVDDEESQTKKKDALDMEEKGELSFEKGALMLPKDDKRNSSSFKSRFFESQIINHFMRTLFETPGIDGVDSKTHESHIDHVLQNDDRIKTEVGDEGSNSEAEFETESLVYLNLSNCDCRFCLLKKNIKSASKPKEAMRKFLMGKLKSFINV